MDTRQLRSFIKIAELHSISRAAVSLGISQPSLSQQLLRLEDEVGAKLFHRTARGVTLTDAGRVFEEDARNILLRSETAVETLRGLRGAASGPVLFAASPSVLARIGVPLMEAVWRHAPEVSLRLVEAFSANIFGWLEAGKIDLGILHDLGPVRNLSLRPLVREELVLVGPAGALDGGGDVPANRLGDYRMIVPGLPHGLRQLLEREATRLRITLAVAAECDSLGQIAALVARGHGYSILPRAAVDSLRAAGEVSLARIGGGALWRTLSLARNTAHPLTHASVLVEHLNAEVMRELAASGVWRAAPPSDLR